MSTATARAGLSAERVKLGVFALSGLGFLALALPAFAEPMTFWTGIVFGDYAYPDHQLHHFVMGTVFPLLLLGVIAQAYRPTERVGALHSSIVIWVSLTVVFSVGGEFSPVQLILLALLGVMALTHPAGPDQLPSAEQLNRPLLVVAAVTAVAGLAFAGLEISSHLSADDTHVGFNHYLFMATTGLSIVALGLYASFRGSNWRFPAYTAALFLLVLGLASVVYPGAEQGSSLGVVGGLAVAIWALVFVGVAERGEAILGRIQS